MYIYMHASHLEPELGALREQQLRCQAICAQLQLDRRVNPSSLYICTYIYFLYIYIYI